MFTYLQSLSESKFEILFVSNSPVSKQDCYRLYEQVPNCKIFERENKGNDFGAWGWALKNNLIPEDTDHLLLTNDSIFGPLFPLEPLFDSMDSNTSIDFWGLTDNYQGGWHLQSYFLYCKKEVFTSHAFVKVITQDFSETNKLQIIKTGEIQWTKSLIDSGFVGIAYIPYKDLVPDFEEWDAKNPTHFFWDTLIEEFNFPFVKKELVLQNPENIQSVARLFQLIETTSSYPLNNIKQSISDYLDRFESTASLTGTASVICHLFYPGTIYHFLTKLLPLRSPQTQFVFNLSAALYHDDFFYGIMTKYFPDAFIIFTPNQGRDIGGKLAALDVLMRCRIETDFSLVIHDKLSPHTPTGIEWRDRLLRIVDPKEVRKIFMKFHDNEHSGIITAAELVKNEYDPDKEKFSCTSSDNIFDYIKKYHLQLSDYEFAAGTIFWIRTSILKKFFSNYPALSIRKELEKGNSLDFDKGTNIHSWERMFSFIANSQGYNTTGI